MVDRSAYQELGATPIPGESPSGKDVSVNSSAFFAIQAEVTKIHAIAAPDVDWKLILREGEKLLREESKDLRVIAWMMAALSKSHRHEGIAYGSSLLRGVIENYWDSLYPKKQSRRENALRGFADEIKRRIAVSNDSNDGDDQLVLVHDDLAFICKSLKQEARELAPVRQLLKRHLARAGIDVDKQPEDLDSAAEPDTSVQSAAVTDATVTENASSDEAPASEGSSVQTTSTPSIAATAQAVPEATLASDADVNKVTRGVQASLLKVVDYLRKRDSADIANPYPYRLLRHALWLGVKAPPATNGEGRCAIKNGLAETTKQQIAGALAAGENERVVQLVEGTLGRSTIYWLDAHRLVAVALDALGHDAARDTVMDTFAGFLRAHPGIEALEFEDGEHFADTKTLLWIKERIIDVVHGTPSDRKPTLDVDARDAKTPASGAVETDGWATAAQEARALLLNQQAVEAIACLDTGRRQAGCERERFNWTLELARVCMDAGYPDIAEPHLEHLESQISEFGLERWDPDLSVTVAKCLLAVTAKSKSKAVEERKKVWNARIARLDAVTAARETSSKKL